MNPSAAPSLMPTRRSFLRNALAAGTGATLLPGFLGSSAHAAVQEDAASSDPNLATLNFALHLEYLEAQYYTLALTGKTLEQSGIDTFGYGNQGTVTVKANPQVPFQSSTIQGIGLEIAVDEQHHVNFLRGTIYDAGSTPAAMPNVDLLNSFNSLASAAGLGDTFDPFANELNFLLGAFIFEDVGVTAYRGGSTALTSKAYLKAAAGILAVEAIHAGEIRALLYSLGEDFISAAAKISEARDMLDGAADKDQGIRSTAGVANIAPTDGNGLVFSRSKKKVLHIVYGSATATSGGFFPSGVNL